MQLVYRVLDPVDAWQRRHRVPSFVVGVIKKYGDDRGGHLAAQIAVYAAEVNVVAARHLHPRTLRSDEGNEPEHERR